MDIKLLALYFVIGGSSVAAVTYFGSQGKSLFAAFIGVLPSVTVISICSIYLNSGTASTLSYVKGLLIFMPAWILYVVGVIFLLPRIGLVGALVISVSVYLIAAFITMKFTSSG